jgi:hypothetical protein
MINFMDSAHLSKGTQSVSEVGASMGQILLLPMMG